MRSPLLALLLTLLAAAPAAADRGPCKPGGGSLMCTVWTGEVTFVADGDTVDVDLDGDASETPVRVRMVGLNVMELDVYSRRPERRRGDCHGVEAAAALDALVAAAGGRARLVVQDVDRSARGHRVRRVLQLRSGDGWIDAAGELLAQGHGLWFVSHEDWFWNRRHRIRARRAAAAGIGLYDTDFCGAGPDQDVPLRVDAHWDAKGNDHRNPNGEWIRVRNRGTRDVPLAGWHVRDSALRRFTFPAGARVRAGRSVRVFVGRGSRTFQWGLPGPAFENRNRRRGIGDGAYLFDPQGDLRAWDIYY